MCRFMLRTKIKKKGLRTKKTKTKFNRDVSFTKNNSIDKTVQEIKSTNATLSSNGCPDASPLHLDNNIKLTVVGSNALRNNVDSVASTCSSTPRGMALLNQKTLYVVPCHQVNMTNATMTDTDKQNNLIPTVPLSHGNGIGNRAFGNFSPQGGAFVSHQQQQHHHHHLYFQSGEQLQKSFQQQQLLVIEHLQRQIKQGMLNIKKSNEATSRCHPQLLGSCNIATNDAKDLELDLDTIFDDNGNNHKNAYKNDSSTRNGYHLLTSELGR